MSSHSSGDYASLDRPEVLQFLFHPRKTVGPRESKTNVEEMLIPVDGDVMIGACVHMVRPAGPLILFFHGNGEVAADYDDIGPLFNRLGINFMVVDYRPTVSAMMADCHRILDFVLAWQKKKNLAGPLIVMGRSLGSASALELAATRSD